MTIRVHESGCKTDFRVGVSAASSRCTHRSGYELTEGVDVAMLRKLLAEPSRLWRAHQKAKLLGT